MSRKEIYMSLDLGQEIRRGYTSMCMTARYRFDNHTFQKSLKFYHKEM